MKATRRRLGRWRAALLAIFGLFVLSFWMHAQLHAMERWRSLIDLPTAGGSTDIEAAVQGRERSAVAIATDKDTAAMASQTFAMPYPAIILFCYDRPDYLNKTLHSLATLEGLHRFAVYVSQDGDHAGVASIVGAAAPTLRASAAHFEHWQKLPRMPALAAMQPGHAWLAQHFKWGLDRVFVDRGHSHAVVVEDDMLFSPDFLLYFEATAGLLEKDPTLWCVSSWNDNGFNVSTHGWHTHRLFRTSYFPGLGWMLRRQLWEELGPHWPLQHWDHWMRGDDVARGRDCVAPEVNRNKNIGEVGANMDQASFKRYLRNMAWNHELVRPDDWGDLSYLLQPGYSDRLQRQLASAEVVQLSRLVNRGAPLIPGAFYLLPYRMEEYKRLAVRLKLWPDPRGHHRGAASIPFRGAHLLLADRRFCPLLPTALVELPTAGLRELAALRNQSCFDACVAAGMRCSRQDFWFLNACSALRRHFPCERGCTVEIGPDIPAYVADPSAPLAAYCLVTHKLATCGARHHATARLCVCAPVAPTVEQPVGYATDEEVRSDQRMGTARTAALVDALKIAQAAAASRHAASERAN